MEPAVKVLLVVAVAFVAISLWRSSSSAPSRETFANWINQEFVTVPPTPFVVPNKPLIVSADVTAAPSPPPTLPPLTPPPPAVSQTPVPVLTQVGTDAPAVVPTLVPTLVPATALPSEVPTLVTTHLGASPLTTA